MKLQKAACVCVCVCHSVSLCPCVNGSQQNWCSTEILKTFWSLILKYTAAGMLISLHFVTQTEIQAIHGNICRDLEETTSCVYCQVQERLRRFPSNWRLLRSRSVEITFVSRGGPSFSVSAMKGSDVIMTKLEDGGEIITHPWNIWTYLRLFVRAKWKLFTVSPSFSLFLSPPNVGKEENMLCARPLKWNTQILVVISFTQKQKIKIFQLQ